MGQNKRNLPGSNTYDHGAIGAMEFSSQAGSKKVSEVGRALLPLGDGNGGFTTNATTATVLPSAGKNLAVYNNSGSVGSITLGTSNALTSLAAGGTNSTGQVGIPCTPNDWTYIACNKNNWVIASASTLLVFIIEDDTSIKTEFQILPGN
jgi:hypothetical protein